MDCGGRHSKVISSSGGCASAIGSAQPAEQAREGAGIEVNLGLVKASYNLGKEVGSNDLRVAFDRLLSKKGEKLLITVDEVHAASMEDMSELSIAYQHAVRKNMTSPLYLRGFLRRSIA